MPVTIKVNFAPLAEFPLSTKEIMREVGLLARERIVRRTATGVDQFGQSFAPYSAAYAKQKAQALGTASVNLQVSGGMLNALTIIDLTDSKVTLGFSS